MESKPLKDVKSISIDGDLWKRAKQQAGPASLSFIITRLVEMWLNGEVKIMVEPVESKS